MEKVVINNHDALMRHLENGWHFGCEADDTTSRPSKTFATPMRYYVHFTAILKDTGLPKYYRKEVEVELAEQYILALRNAPPPIPADVPDSPLTGSW